MAISKILHMKDCGRSFHGKHLKYALEYITVPEKTQNGRLVSAINCQVDNAFEQMKETKKKFNKTDKRQAYHIILSFKEGEVSPDTVFELTERFVKEYLGNDYEAVFAVHDNTEHPHSHIVFNSVSFRDGKKYHYQKVQTAIVVSEDTITKEPLEKEQAKELTEMIRSLTEAVQSHTGNYEAIEKMLKQMETIRLDEAVAKNLTSLNEKLEKENREFTEQLEGKQNEVNKGLQTIAQLRTELENLKKEMKIMQDRNTDLEQQISQRDETIREQGQAIIAKNSTIEKYKSAEEKAADEQHHGRTDLQEETVEKQSEIEMKENYDSQAVGQTQGAIPKQAATIPAGAIPVYANAGGIPVYYTMTLVQDQKVLQRTDVDYMHRKPSVFEGIMSKFAFKKKSHKDLVQLVINKELSPEQVNAIRGGLESGLDEEQLELIINKNLTPEKMQSIIRFAALQNSLKAERGGV